MKLSIRTRRGNGWWKEVENRSKTHCDICGERLWVNPGGAPYCNSWEPDHDQPGRYETLREERRNDITVSLTKDNVEHVYRLEWIRPNSHPFDARPDDGAVGEDTYQTYDDALADFDNAFARHALHPTQVA
jgi:hypothetical protein